MKCHLRAGLIVLVSVPIALAATGSAAAITSLDPTPSASPSAVESPTPSPPTAASELPRTNLTAVVDPIAVPVRDGFRVRVGVRNSGPLPITAPEGQPAVGLALISSFGFAREMRPLGDCEDAVIYPPNWPARPPEPIGYSCVTTKRTLRVGETYWESFVFGRLPDAQNVCRLVIRGFAEDTDGGDNVRNVVVRVGSSLPVTGPRTINIAGAGLALVIAGTMAVWCSRRRWLVRGDPKAQ